MISWIIFWGTVQYQELLGKTLLYDILGEEAKKHMKKLWFKRNKRKRKLIYHASTYQVQICFPESEGTWWNNGIFAYLWKVQILMARPASYIYHTQLHTTYSEKRYTTLMKTMQFTRYTKVTGTSWNSWSQAGLCTWYLSLLHPLVSVEQCQEALFTRKELMQYLVRSVRESPRFEIGLLLACTTPKIWACNWKSGRSQS